MEPGSLAWKSNAQLFSQLATRYLVVHKVIAIYYSSSEIFTYINVKQHFSQQLRQKNVLLFEFRFSVGTCEISCFTYYSRRHGVT